MVGIVGGMKQTNLQEAIMARREDLMEALDAIETGMCRIKESRDIWQNDLVYALCQAVRLILMEEVKHGRQ